MRAAHGGNMRALGGRLGRDPASLLDFSANVNPLGPPDGVRAVLRACAADPSALTRYPDPCYADLRRALGRRHAVDARRIVVANGAAALIGAAIRAIAPRRCVLPVPAFSEYAKALADAGAEAVEVPGLPATFALDTDAIVRAVRATAATCCIFSNPNNPTGFLTPRADVVALADRLHGAGCISIVDEAFVDYVPDASCIDDARDAIVIRSLTKFYAIPGVRIGYAIAPAPHADAIAAVLPSWPIGILEERIALAAIDDAGYDARTRAANASERDRMHGALTALGYGVAPSAANFLFVDVAPAGTTAAPFARDLAERYGIAVRTCDDYRGLPGPTFVRVALRSRADDDRLLQAFRRLGEV